MVATSFWLFQFHKSKLPYYYIVLGMLFGVAFVMYRLNRSRLGFYLKALRESSDGAESLGVSTRKCKVLATAISGFITAVAGTFYAQYVLYIDPASTMHLRLSIEIVLVTMLGGIGTITGPIIGASLLIILSEVFRVALGGAGRGVDLMIYGILIMIISVLMPEGIGDLLLRRSNMEPILKVTNLTKTFAGLVANENITFDVREGEIVSIIGPNGAGKTTLFNCVTGFLKPSSGSVTFDSHRVEGWSPNKIARKGLVRTFQIVQAFREMTVLENVMVGAFIHTRDFGVAENEALEILTFTGLMNKKDSLGKDITIADKKRLEIARAIASKPRMLLLDECIAGLNATEVNQAVDLLQKIRESGVTLLIVEHVMEVIMPLSSKVVVLESGRKIAEGKPSDVASNDRVIKAYLGERYSA